MTTQKNPYYLKNIDKLPETATVSYFDVNEWNKGLTPEELAQQENINNSYIAEWEELGKMNGYGPGWGEDLGKNLTKKIGSVALAASYFTPAVVITGPLTIGAVAGGGAMWIGGKLTDDKQVADIGGEIFEFALGAAADGISGGTAGTAVAQTGRVIAKGINLYGDVKDIEDGTYYAGKSLPSARQLGEASTFIVKNLL